MANDQKAKQEYIIGNILSSAYEKDTGYPLMLLPNNAGDPPDLLFEWQGFMVGVEITELHQFQDQRGLLDNIAQEVSTLISRSGKSDKYVGMVVNFGILLDSKGRDPINSAWKNLSVKQPRHKAAEELVALLFEQIPTVDDIPENSLGKILSINANENPALHALVKKISVHRCELPDNPDETTWPRIVSYLGSKFDHQEMELRVVDRISSKAKSKINKPGPWVHINHSILVAHDLTRDLTSFSLTTPWERWLKSSIFQTDVLLTYDELWLVTFDNLHGRGLRIGGTPPSNSISA